MENTDNLDRLIKEYSGLLMKTYEQRNPSLKSEETVYEPAAAMAVLTEKPTATEDALFQPEENPPEKLSGTASFTATVRTGGGAFPVPEAKIIIQKDGAAEAFLVTDENGDTPTVSLPAYPKSDSLSYETAKEVMYYADVFATGFQTKQNLPVSAVGGAEIVLNVELTPNEERME